MFIARIQLKYFTLPNARGNASLLKGKGNGKILLSHLFWRGGGERNAKTRFKPVLLIAAIDNHSAGKVKRPSADRPWNACCIDRLAFVGFCCTGFKVQTGSIEPKLLKAILPGAGVKTNALGEGTVLNLPR